MGKKDNSLLGSIFKGAVDLTAGVLKHGYDAAEEVVKAGYGAATSKTAKKIYKKTGDTALDLMRFTPPKEKLDQMKDDFTKVEESIAKLFCSCLLHP